MTRTTTARALAAISLTALAGSPAHAAWLTGLWREAAVTAGRGTTMEHEGEATAALGFFDHDVHLVASGEHGNGVWVADGYAAQDSLVTAGAGVVHAAWTLASAASGGGDDPPDSSPGEPKSTAVSRLEIAFTASPGDRLLLVGEIGGATSHALTLTGPGGVVFSTTYGPFSVAGALAPGAYTLRVEGAVSSDDGTPRDTWGVGTLRVTPKPLPGRAIGEF